MTLIALALGSNLGDRLGNLQTAIDCLSQGGVTITAVSSTWETPPIPDDQPRFLNIALAAETDLEPPELLTLAKKIEVSEGRRPTRYWGPRTCDIDILFYGDQVISSPTLTVPHPRLASRAFVLAPLAEVLTGPLPVLGVRALSLLAATDSAGLHRTGLKLKAGI